LYNAKKFLWLMIYAAIHPFIYWPNILAIKHVLLSYTDLMSHCNNKTCSLFYSSWCIWKLSLSYTIFIGPIIVQHKSPNLLSHYIITTRYQSIKSIKSFAVVDLCTETNWSKPVGGKHRYMNTNQKCCLFVCLSTNLIYIGLYALQLCISFY